MITPRLTCCKECADALALVKEIDCKLYELSLNAYNNIAFSLNLNINQEAAIDLLTYKRILLYKSQNENYACNYSVNMIASKIKKYVVGCKKNCNCSDSSSAGFLPPKPPVPYTTTTSTTAESTTSTTSSTTSIPITVLACDILLCNAQNIISYNYDTNVYQFLSEISFGGSPDLANSDSKLWIMGGNFIQEYNITLDPWTLIHNRSIEVILPPSNILGAGLTSKTNTILIGSYGRNIIEIDITNDPASFIVLFQLPVGDSVAGDILLTVEDKLIISTIGSGNKIQQYNYLTNALEISIDTGLFQFVGLFENNDEIFGIDSAGVTYNIQRIPPYTITVSKDSDIGTAGASQQPSCILTSIHVPDIRRYNVTCFTPGTCTVTPFLTVITNQTPLTVGKYYYDPLYNVVFLINSFIGYNGSISTTILDSTQQDTCSAASPPPINFSFDNSDWFTNTGVTDESTFITFLGIGGIIGVTVLNFSIVNNGTLQCNLTFTTGTILNISNKGITKINNTDSLGVIQVLDLSDNSITVIENINSNNLKTLKLPGNSISVIQNLSNLPNLEILQLEGNSITVIQNLEGLLNLIELYLNSNQITAIENLNALSNLQTLSLISNTITTVNNLSGLTSLVNFYIAYNNIPVSEFDILDIWAVVAPNDGVMAAFGNPQSANYASSPTYTTLTGKGWTVMLVE